MTRLRAVRAHHGRCSEAWSTRLLQVVGRCVEARGRDDLLGIDDQGDAPVSQDGRRGDSGYHAVVFLQALDDDLALVVDHVHGERRAASGLTFHEEENVAVDLAPGWVTPKASARSMIGISSPRLATTRPVRPMAWIVALDGRSVSRIGRKRQNHHLAAELDQHAFKDGEGERQGDGERRALSRRGLDRDAPAQRLDLAAHHVETDATARQGRNLVLRGKAGREEKVVDLAGAQASSRARPGPFPPRSKHLLPVDTGTVVGHLDDDAPRSMRRGKGDRTGFRLALRDALGGLLEAMVDGIPDHVGQGIDEPLDHGLVDLGRLSHRDEANLFPVASAASRMILCILWNTGFNGCARMAMTLSWMPEASCLIPSRPFETSLSEARPALSTA
jgi:hypothetical protein